MNPNEPITLPSGRELHPMQEPPDALTRIVGGIGEKVGEKLGSRVGGRYAPLTAIIGEKVGGFAAEEAFKFVYNAEEIAINAQIVAAEISDWRGYISPLSRAGMWGP